MPDVVPETLFSCVICMEDFLVQNVRQHNACPCVMCSPCLERTLEHHQSDEDVPVGQIKCPGCLEKVDPITEFVTIDQIGKSKPKLKIFTIPVVMRVTSTESVRTFGYPFLITVPNQITGKQLHKLISPLIKVHVSFGLVLVSSNGKGCSRCLFSERCKGCLRIPDNDEVVMLQSADNLAISYFEVDVTIMGELYLPEQHTSMLRKRAKDKLSLEECLEAFSEEESLDESNPWYCPMCRKNQCATKTLTIWKFPDYLILYLKR